MMDSGEFHESPPSEEVNKSHEFIVKEDADMHISSDGYQVKLSARSMEETISRATAAAVAFAEGNHRSDSILSPDNSEDGGDDDDDDSCFDVSRGRSLEMRASGVSDGSFGDSVREWEHSRFSTVPVGGTALEHGSPQLSSEAVHDDQASLLPDSVEGILKSCGALTLSVASLQTMCQRSEADVIRALYKARPQSNFELPDLSSYDARPPFTDAPHAHVLLLFSLFATFCKPPPTMDSVRKIYVMECSGHAIGEPVVLPMDSLLAISTPHKEAVVNILQSHRHLLHLPPAFQHSFFRILTRLLTNATDEEYDRDSLLLMKWARDTGVESKESSLGFISKIRDLQQRTHERVNREKAKRAAMALHREEQVRLSSGKRIFSKRMGRAYSFVRFHAGDAWRGKTAVSTLLELVHVVRLSNPNLLPPVVALLGQMCTAGVTVCELLTMLRIAAQPVESREFLDRVLMVKALTAAAEGDSLSTYLVGKASPKHFFSFGRSSTGLSRTISSLSQWPFRNDFGMAVWFRCESFDQNENPSIVSIISHDGAGVDVSLMLLEDDKSASNIVVTVRDADGLEVDRVTVRNCVLHPRVWYHLGVRHTRSRLKGVFSLSARQQISVFLDGKLMLTEPLRFPNIVAQDTEVTTKSFLSGLQLGKPNTISLTVQFGAHFDGQTGSLYLFNDNVSDATLRALCVVTSGTRHGLVKKNILNDYNWDIKNNIGKAVVELNSIDADEVVMAQDRIPRIQKWSSAVVDLSDADDSESDVIPELSRAALHSKLFLVWDPSRIEGSIVIDLHSAADATMKHACVQASCMDGAKDVIASIGGVQALLPIADSLLSGEIEQHWNHPSRGNDPMNERFNVASTLIVPSLLSMFAGFLHNHDNNAREMMRCGGIDILEQRLLQSKELGSSIKSLVGVLATAPDLANLLVDALLGLRIACEHYVSLESTVFSRLLFNMPLWFGGSSLPTGVALYPTLLPILSTITSVSAHKVRNTIGVRPLFELLHLFTDIGETELEVSKFAHEPATELFDRSEFSGLSEGVPLTIHERRHVIDVALGMIAKILQSGSTTGHLSVLINYVSFNADNEWEEGSRQSRAGVNPNTRTGTRYERHRSTIKACTILSILLKARPVNHELLSSLNSCCGGPQAVLAWILSTLVNSFDDELRSIGIRCLGDFMDAVVTKADVLSHAAQDDSNDEIGRGNNSTVGKKSRKVTATFTSVGKSLTTAIGGQVFATVMPPHRSINIEIVYKLLWHLLKCHRARMGRHTHAALNYLLVEDIASHCNAASLMDQLVITDRVFGIGYRLSLEHENDLLLKVESVEGNKIRRDINLVLRLLRFLPNTWKDKWLQELVTLTQTCAFNIQILVEDPDWQPSLFHVISDCLEEIDAKYGARTHDREVIEPSDGFDKADESAGESNDAMRIKEVRSGELFEMTDHTETTPDDQVQMQIRFDLSLKLFCTLLCHCFRLGGDKGINAVELAASLERICVNGHDVLCLILNRLLSDLIENGTVDNLKNNGVESKWPLKESARLVTEAILMKGSNSSIDASFALKQWHALRHLAVVVSCTVIKCGFGSGDLFECWNQPAVLVDAISGGLNGIRLSDSHSTALNAAEYMKTISIGTEPRNARSVQGRYCRMSVYLSVQTLSLLDAFIFPDSLDASLPISQLHGLALVRSNEARLGVSQGPILASLVRLSLVLLCHLEPSSIQFLQCCSRLRCFLHWSLELIRESVALAGYSAAFHDLTAPLDRLVLAIVLHCHRALSKCSAVITEMQSSSLSSYFSDEEGMKKYDRRLLRVSFELRDIVVTAYRGRNEVLRAALSFQAFEALQDSLERNNNLPMDIEKKPQSKETLVRLFLNSVWVRSFHDVGRQGDLFIPDQVANGQQYQQKTASYRGLLAIKELSAEGSQNVFEFDRALDTPFKLYLEDQKNWAETDQVRDLEYDGDATVKRFSLNHRSAFIEAARNCIDRANGAANRWEAIKLQVLQPWTVDVSHWQLGERSDRLGRRILMVRNRKFNKHEDASYELMLGMERERAERDREERRRKKAEQERESLVDLVKRNAAYVPYGAESIAEDEEEGEMDDSLGNGVVANEGEVVDSSPAVGIDKGNPARVPLFESDTEVHEIYSNQDATDEDAWAKSFVWADIESIVARFDAVEVVTVRTISVGKLLLTSHGLFFHQCGETINVMTKEVEKDPENDKLSIRKGFRWRLSRLREAHGRRFMLRAQAIELFFADGTELFFNFKLGARERDRFYAKLRNSSNVPLLWSPKSLNPRVVFKKSKISQLWRRGKISNFEYIMHLNKFAGRTFNDVTQYPVFPWVLADYTSETIDLKDSKVYRDLSKPVGALNEERLSSLIERYNELASFGFADNERFLYGSHYSSPGVVLHYLIRQEPFTSMAIELQSGRFDCPDRLFFDLAGCWVSCMTSTSDVKELVPELFTCPEVLMNTNGFPLGRTQENRNISDVTLPPWAKGSAHEFIRIQRMALESDYVSSHLNLWIDLIFGYKQRGPEAESAHNVFHYLSYEGAIDMDKITDELERKATESQIQNFGQTPSQLMPKDPHPSRYPSHDRWRPLIYDQHVPSRLVCHTPSKQFSQKHSKGAVVSLYVLTDSILVVYADMSVGTYKFTPLTGNNKRPFVFKADKHKCLAKPDLSISRSSVKRAPAVTISASTNRSDHSISRTSFALTLGGLAAESIRRKAQTGRVTTSNDPIKESEASAYLLSCGYWDDTVRVHTLDGLKLLCSDVGGHRGPIRCMSMGTDGALMVTGGQDATCRVWVVDHLDMALALRDGYTQTSLGLPNDSGNLLKLCHVLWGHAHPISCLDMSSELDVVVSGDLGGVVCVHTIRRGEFIRSILPKSNWPCCALKGMALESNGTFIVHMADRSLHAITINDIHLCSCDAEDDLYDIRICSGGEILVTGGEKGLLVIRLMKDLSICSTLDISKHGPIRCISLTPDDHNPTPQYMFIGSDDGLITVVSEDQTACDS